MTTNIGAPFIPPDNVNLAISSTGTLQLKAGTQGDLLIAGASGVWTKLAAGTAGQFLQTQGASSNPTWSNAVGEGWNYITKMTPSAAASVTSSTLTAYDEYMIRTTNLVMSAGAYIQGQLNGDTGNNYRQTYLFTAAVQDQSSQPNFAIGGASTTDPASFIIQLTGKSPAVASGKVTGVINACYIGSPLAGLSFTWTAGNAVQVTTITLLTSTGTMTGTIEVFGRNRN